MAAFFFDRAVGIFGSAVDKAVAEARDGKKEKAADAAESVVMNKWLGMPLKFASPTPTRR
jgi:hypothetical protein